MKRLTITLILLLSLTVARAQEVVDYGIRIDGVDVTSENADSVPVYGNAGLIRYEATTGTLYLDNTSFRCLENRSTPLTIHLSGYNQAYGVITSDTDLTFSGQGRINITYDRFDYSDETVPCPILLNNGNLTVTDGCMVEAYSARPNAIRVLNGKLIIHASKTQSNSDFLVSSIETDGVVCHCQNNWVTVYGPEDDNAEFYDLILADMPITTYNASDIRGSNIIKGSAYYSPYDGTLHLDNVSIDDGTNMPLHGDGDIRLALKGRNNLAVELNSFDARNVTVEGSGSIVIGSAFNSLSISTLILNDGCKFECEGGVVGFSGPHITNLIVNGSTFIADAPTARINYIELNGSAIVSPDWISYDGINHKLVYDANGGSGGMLIIKPIANNLNEVITANTRLSDEWFNIQGQRCNNRSGNGFMIHNRKVIKIEN